MDIQSDEMFKLLKVKHAEWAQAAKLASQVVTQVNTAAASTKPAKAKPGKQPEEEKKQSAQAQAPVFVNTTPEGQKKDMSQPMANEY